MCMILYLHQFYTFIIFQYNINLFDKQYQIARLQALHDRTLCCSSVPHNVPEDESRGYMFDMRPLRHQGADSARLYADEDFKFTHDNGGHWKHCTQVYFLFRYVLNLLVPGMMIQSRKICRNFFYKSLA